jgi:hypothetical protein
MTSVRNRLTVLAVAAALLSAGVARADDKLLDSLKKGTPDLKSAGALAFGPDGILFVGDPMGATIYAIDTGDRTAPAKAERPKVMGLDEKIAAALGIEAKQLLINDMAVNPISHNTYLSLSRGRGPDAKPALMRVSPDGKLSEVALKDVKFAKATLPNPAEGRSRQDAITQIAYVKGKLYVAGLSNEKFASNLRAIPFPFAGADKGTSVEIYHGGHGAFETRSPVRTFVPYTLKNETYLLAAYQCTPLVRFPVSELKPGEKMKGTTVAELGQGNRPLDMIVYTKGGKDYILMANSARGVMKIPTEGIDKAASIPEERVRGTAGTKYETIKDLKGVQQLDRFDKDHALLLTRTSGGAFNLETIELP